MKPAKSSVNRRCRSAITTRSLPRSGGFRDGGRANRRSEPRCLAECRIDARLPTRAARTEMGYNVAVEPQRDELFGGRLLQSARAAIRFHDVRHDLACRAHTCPHFVGELERIGVLCNTCPDFRILCVGHCRELAKRLASRFTPSLF